MMMTENTEHFAYSSLTEIRLRKELLRKDIQADDEKIKRLWNTLFAKPSALTRSASPSSRMKSLFSIGAGAFDGAVLAWKLYRKFKKK